MKSKVILSSNEIELLIDAIESYQIILEGDADLEQEDRRHKVVSLRDKLASYRKGQK